MNTLTLYFFTGFFGDMALQLINKFRGNIAGLDKYFKLHGSIESLFIAGGMLWLFAFIYDKSKLPFTYQYLFMYGGLLDILFRQLMIFPSLDTYYAALTPEISFIWGGIPMIAPLLIKRIIQ